MKKPIVVSIGELGWDLYLVSHLRFLREYYGFTMAVMTYEDRQCLYKNVADEIFDIPTSFYREFDISEQECFGIKASSDSGSALQLKTFFTDIAASLDPPHYIPKGFEFTCRHFGFAYKHEPFPYSKELPGQLRNTKKEILVFPRWRSGRFTPRNLPLKFYADLIYELCKKFPQYIVRTVGLESGSYKLDKIIAKNYICSVKKKADLQDLIDHCQLTIAAVGSQSALPKITLLQGIPTFMIGHEVGRHTELENWMKTKCGFYEIRPDEYQTLNTQDCIEKIIYFIKGLEKRPLIISSVN